jgi:hypothetical protein
MAFDPSEVFGIYGLRRSWVPGVETVVFPVSAHAVCLIDAFSTSAHVGRQHSRLAGFMAFGARIADSEGCRSRIRDDVAHHSDLMSLGVPR